MSQPWKGHVGSSASFDPMTQLLENLKRETDDLRDLRGNSDRLFERTVKLVDIRMEDHGKTILVFTLVTVIFLPLSFVTSFFGMNVSDIRNMDGNQSLFWAVAVTVTAVVVGIAVVFAFYGSAIMEAFALWRESPKLPTIFRNYSAGSRETAL